MAAAALRSADLAQPVTDPSVWLDVHRDLKQHLRDARVALTRRDQAESAQEQHEAAGDARRCLVRAGTMVSSLEGGLNQMASETGDAGLGAGEVRRRRDLLGAAKKERESLEGLSSTFVPRSGVPGHERAMASRAEKEELFSSGSGTSLATAGSSASKPAAGRRVFGAKETDRTRELDNAGVLQLQKQIMQEQDEDVTDLTKVVMRMKQMGIQINDELQVQNEMLGMLEQDVDRVDDKIKVAKKRVDKIK